MTWNTWMPRPDIYFCKHMNKRLLMILLPLAALSACRKGAEDPLISLRSRQNRLCKTWVLTNVLCETKTSSNTFVTIVSQELRGDSLIISQQSGSGTFRSAEQLNYECTFHKDGNFDVSRISTSTASFINHSTWQWANAAVRKSAVAFISGIDFDGTAIPWTITRLSDTELVLDYQKAQAQSASSFSFTSETTGHLEFRAKK